MENLEKLFKDDSYELFIEGPGSYIFIETKTMSFNSSATYPEGIVRLDKNAIITIAVVIVAVILVAALVIYCCVDYRKSALKEHPIYLGPNNGFG